MEGNKIKERKNIFKLMFFMYGWISLPFFFLSILNGIAENPWFTDFEAMALFMLTLICIFISVISYMLWRD